MEVNVGSEPDHIFSSWFSIFINSVHSEYQIFKHLSLDGFVDEAVEGDLASLEEIDGVSRKGVVETNPVAVDAVVASASFNQ